MSRKKKVHFVGIKGVGMTPLAIIAKEAGFEVTGCDIDDQFITDEPLSKAGIKPLVGFDSKHVEGCDLVITTGALGGFDNVENKRAKTLSIPVLTQGQALGEFMEGTILGRKFEGISVSGSHGKTTTTAMIATILKENNFDPTFLIGTGNVSSLGSSGHLGKGNYFVAEADEYATEPNYDKTPKFLWQKPRVAVITNIELDHPDLYPTLTELKKAYFEFIGKVREGGTLVVCGDDRETMDLLKNYDKKYITYGFSKNSDYYIDRISIEQEKMFIWVNAGETSLGEFPLNVVGEHNGLNALASLVVCLELGLSIENIRKGLAAFKGTKRRFEYVGVTRDGALLYDDYAHHPTEIRKTLETFRKSFPRKRIICIFQPHTYSRTKTLFEQFVGSFSNADVLILVKIYASQREEIDSSVSSELLAKEVSKIHKNVTYIENLQDVVKYLGQKSFGRDNVIVTMGAGDIYKIGEELI